MRQQPQVAVAAATPPAPVTLADLVAPIALYPDQLLGQVLTISSTPQEVLDLGNWLIENDTLTGSKAQDAAKAAGFSTSAQYLALFPQVVDNMAQQIDWTTQLGDAFTDKPKDVMAAIQAKRVAAEKAGNLKTSSQMTVETKKADNGTLVHLDLADRSEGDLRAGVQPGQRVCHQPDASTGRGADDHDDDDHDSQFWSEHRCGGGHRVAVVRGGDGGGVLYQQRATTRTRCGAMAGCTTAGVRTIRRRIVRRTTRGTTRRTGIIRRPTITGTR